MPCLPRADALLSSANVSLRTTVLSLLALSCLAVPLRATAEDEDPLKFVAFSTDFDAKCVDRKGVMIYIANKHPSRAMKLVLERWYMDNRTADRGKSLLKPGEEPEPLGCSNIEGGKQEWKILKSEWVD